MSTHEWAQGFERQTPESFGSLCAEDVVLHAGILTRPVAGRDDVARVMAVASGIYDPPRFIDQAQTDGKTWMQWETSVQGRELFGITVLRHDDAGLIVEVRVHFLPFPHVAFARDRLLERLAGSGLELYAS